MADVDELPRSLALAKAGLLSPEGARARVKARLAASTLAAEASSSGGIGWRGLGLTRARAWTVGLMSLSFVAGYWLGGERMQRRDEPSSALLQPASRASDGESGAAMPQPVRSEPLVGAEVATSTPLSDLSSAKSLSGASRRKNIDTKVAPRAARAIESDPVEGLQADGLAREVALLQRVERAIRAGEGQLALVLLAEHEREFPASSFREERAAARVLAACVAQRGSEAQVRARAEAQRYLSGRTHSVYADRIRTLCQINLSSEPREIPGSGH